MIACDDSRLVVCYYLPIPHPGFDGTNPLLVSKSKTESGVCVLEADLLAVLFGHPNDEALSGHPLYERGLGPYGTYEVLNSSWIRQMEARNRVAFPETKDWLSSSRHVVVCFHDTTLEFVASSWKHRVIHGTVHSVFAQAITAMSQ